MVFSAATVLEYIRTRGPAVPNQLRQALGAKDNFIVGAILSELVGGGKLAMTNLDYGTSKFYYDPSKPESIESLAQYLGEKDRRAFTLLKAERVLRHSALSPLNRVAMTNIPDFARSLKLETPEGPELFWRYYLIPEEEAMDTIERTFFARYRPQTTFSTQPLHPPPIPSSSLSSPSSPSSPSSLPSSSSSLSSSSSFPRSSLPPSLPVSVSSSSTTPQQTTLLASSTPPAKTPVSSKKSAPRKKSSLPTASSPAHPTRLPPVSVAAANGFAAAIHVFFSEKKIVLVQNVASTKTEFSAIVRIPSAVGAVEYFCKAKSKKTTTDGDLASAVLESQQYKLPLLFLSAGKLTKKAIELLPGLKGAVVATLGEGGDPDGGESSY